MSICTDNSALWMGPSVVTVRVSEDRQRDRIMAALGSPNHDLPKVDEKTLSRYYQYLSASLSFPFVAHYPEPRNAREQTEFRCVVVELLNPRKYLGDEFDGIFCKTRKGKYELNLPLIELELPQDDPNAQLIEDYWFWFWNWR